MDSKSLLQFESPVFPSPKACLASEFNLEATILATLQALSLVINLNHVKSHQDKKQPDFLKLKWEAQLNLVCERLAG
jgi:hypothetical protein